MRKNQVNQNLDQPYIERLKDVTFQPVFIIGDHRSGTTVLYELLQATGCFNVVTAYHVLKYDEILYNHCNAGVEASKQELASRFHDIGLRDRGIDQVAITPDTPEEYAYAFPSPGYKPMLNRNNHERFVELCQKIQYTCGLQRPLLLKNPWDVFNFVYLKEVFPHSKFIFLHRHPMRTINSQLMATRSLLKHKNSYVALVVQWYNRLLQSPLRLKAAQLLFSSALGVRIVIRHVELATTYFLENIPGVPEQDYICVRYEDLCHHPDAHIHSILHWLDLRTPNAVGYESLIQMRCAALLPEVEKRCEAIYSRLQPYYDYCGYEAATW